MLFAQTVSIVYQRRRHGECVHIRQDTWRQTRDGARQVMTRAAAGPPQHTRESRAGHLRLFQTFIYKKILSFASFIK